MQEQNHRMRTWCILAAALSVLLSIAKTDGINQFYNLHYCPVFASHGKHP